MNDPRITPHHLAQEALLYIRPSSPPTTIWGGRRRRSPRSGTAFSQRVLRRFEHTAIVPVDGGKRVEACERRLS
jgi:hypothetical protein